MYFRWTFCTDLPPWQCGTMRGGQEYAGGSTEDAFNYFVCSPSWNFLFVISFSNIYVIRLFDSQCMFWIGLFWQPTWKQSKQIGPQLEEVKKIHILFYFVFSPSPSFQVACLRKTRSMGKKLNILTKSLFGVREKWDKLPEFIPLIKPWLVGGWFSQKLVLCENNAKRSGSTLPSCPLRRIYGAGWGNIKLGMSTIYKTHVNYFQQTKNK